MLVWHYRAGLELNTGTRVAVIWGVDLMAVCSRNSTIRRRTALKIRRPLLDSRQLPVDKVARADYVRYSSRGALRFRLFPIHTCAG